jgi:hypothetical protein
MLNESRTGRLVTRTYYSGLVSGLVTLKGINHLWQYSLIVLHLVCYSDAFRIISFVLNGKDEYRKS